LGPAAALAGLNEPDAIAAADVLADARILEPGQPLRFVHPLLAGVIYDDLPAARRAAMHRRAADILHEGGAESGLVAAHLLRCDPASDPWVVAQLRTAAAGHVGRGAPKAAVVVLRRAVAEPPTAAMRAEVLYELGRAEGLVRDPSAVADLTEALRLSDDWRLRATVSEDLAALFVFSGSWDAAVTVVEGALADLGDHDPDAAVRLEA
jgi:hypothetical protein